MKKFLFTLAVLLMAGSMYAEDYLYIEDFEVPASVMAETSNKKRSMEVYVKASFESYVSAMMVTFTAPEGATVYDVTVGEDYPLTYNDKNDNEVTFSPSFGYNSETCVGIAAVLLEEGFYYPEGTDPDEDDPVSYGNPKWIGQYDKWLKVTIRFAADFTGGELMVKSEPSCTPDPRGNVCPAGQENYHACNITVEGATPTVLTGEIVIGDPDENGYVAISYTGPEDVTIKVMIDGVYVPLTDGKVFLGAYGEAVITVEVSAEGYETMTATKTVNWEEPVMEQTLAPVINGYTTEGIHAYFVEIIPSEESVIYFRVTLPDGYVTEWTEYEDVLSFTMDGTYMIEAYAVADGKTPSEVNSFFFTLYPSAENLTGEIIVSEPTEDGFVTVTYTGSEDVTILVNGEPYDGGDIQLNDGENTITVTVIADGYNTMEKTFTIVWDAPEPPYETPAPVITTELTNEALVVTATGEGTVTLNIQYIDNETGEMTTETYTGEGTVSVPVERGEVAFYINYWASAQADEDAIPGITVVEYFVEVPAISGQDPHMTGHWLVAYTLDGQEQWYEFIYDKDNYTMILPLDYDTFGTFDYFNGETRPNINFNIVIDGVMYGAADPETTAELGNALLNPLFEGNNEYVLEEGLGHIYNMGLFIDPETGEVYVYAAIAGYTDVNEVNAAKTVAGVRYYNMAGQEMQEANGVTIVVTTYTDGTTSAVKVMK